MSRPVRKDADRDDSHVREAQVKQSRSQAAAAQGFIVMVGLLLVVAMAWSWFGRLDVVSVANGEVVPGSDVKTVQHLEGGIVKAILVKEGQRVAEGQALIELDPTRTNADLHELQIRLLSLRIDKARLRAQIDNRFGATKKSLFSGELLSKASGLVDDAMALLRSRQKLLQHQIEVQRQTAAQREAEIAEVKARLSTAAQARRYLKEQVAISKKLLKRDVTNRMTHLDLLRELLTIEGQIAADKAQKTRAEAGLVEARARIEGIREEAVEAARSELGKVQSSLQELEQRYAKYTDALQRSVLRSPVAGVVKTLAVSAVGQVIRAGDTVLEIVPAGDPLLINAKLPVQDIGYVQKGQKVSITLASADAARFDQLEGRVIGISPDSLLTDQGQAYYKVRVEPGQDHFVAGNNVYRLYPGMVVSCSIITGQRRVAEYLLSPLFKSMRPALQER